MMIYIPKVGIKNQNDREAIILATENYLMEKKLHESEHSHGTSSSAAPSAPEEIPTSSNANKNEDSQGINTTECVICMDMTVSLVFITFVVLVFTITTHNFTLFFFFFISV